MPKKLTNEEYIQKIRDKNILHAPLEEYKGSLTKIKHKCPRGHEWLIQPSNILRGVGCPHCNGNAHKSHEQYENELFNIEADLYPIEKYKSAREKINHICVAGHINYVSPNTVLNSKIGCSQCGQSKGFNPAIPAHLYYVKITEDNLCYYKIGITNRSIPERFKEYRKTKDIVILLDKYYEKGIEAKNEESRLLKLYEKDRVKIDGFLKYGGNSELFEIDVLNLDI